MWQPAVAVVVLVIPLGLDLYMPVPEGNPLTADRIAQGRALFFDRRLSRDRSLSCATCHFPRRAFSDGRRVAVGIQGRTGRRNAPALINRGYGRAFFWDGRADSLEAQVLAPIEDPNELGFSAAEAADRVGLSEREMAFALASYVRSILSGDSRFDRFVNGDRGALDAREQAGLRIFRGKGNCTACHVGPNFTDERFHDTGVAWQATGVPADDASAGPRDEVVVAGAAGRPVAPGAFLDLGRAGVTRRDKDRGAFKTPPLREVARTAPYMHDGSLPTLEAVVSFYDAGGRPNPNLDTEVRPLGLTAEEQRSLVAFLRTLSGRVREGAR
jgi:cytochrome c peroxidase